jgi:hypothetical protein
MALTKVTSGIRTLATDEVVAANITDANVTTAKIADNAVTSAKLAGMTAGTIKIGDASGDPADLAVGTAGQLLKTQAASNPPAWVWQGIVQSAIAQDGAVATGTTVTLGDDTIPQNTEGVEVITKAITPKDSAHRLFIIAQIAMANTTADNSGSIALFQDSTADALVASPIRTAGGANVLQTYYLIHEMAAGTASSTTFKIRGGFQSAGTTTFNGVAGSRTYGGVSGSSLMIFEYKAAV